MNPSPDSANQRWDALAARAQSDLPPPLDPAAALRAARTAAAAPAVARSPAWLDDFTAFFGTPARLAGCGGFAALTLIAAIWFGTTVWTQLEPWADLVGSMVEVSS